MTEQENIMFMELLDKFIKDCGLDCIDICHKAIELQKLINEQ